MGPGQDRTRDPWICSQTRICSQTSYRLHKLALCTECYFILFLRKNLCCGGTNWLTSLSLRSFDLNNCFHGEKKKKNTCSAVFSWKKCLPISDCLQTQKSRTDQDFGEINFSIFLLFLQEKTRARCEVPYNSLMQTKCWHWSNGQKILLATIVNANTLTVI